MMKTKELLTDKVLFSIAIELSNSEEYSVYSKQNNISITTLSISDTLEEYIEKGTKSKELKHILNIMKLIINDYEDDYDLIQKYGIEKGAIKVKLPEIDKSKEIEETIENIPIIHRQDTEDSDVNSTILDSAMTLTTYAAYLLTVRKLSKEDIEVIEKIEELLSKSN